MSAIERLESLGMIKRGEFTLKSGKKSNIYINLRELYSYPKLLNIVADEIYGLVDDLTFDILCGIPDTGFALATSIACRYNRPMILKKKEYKSYGMKNIIDGIYHQGVKCVLVDDLITTGSSIRETLPILKEHGIHVIAIVVYIDRSECGIDEIDGIPVKSAHKKS